MRDRRRFRPRGRRVVLGLLALEAAAAVALAAAGAAAGGDGAAAALAVRRALVAELRLTDLALWPDAGYCRHPSQADLFAAWSEHPGAPEHFPAGSIVPPPPALRGAARGVAGGAAEGP